MSRFIILNRSVISRRGGATLYALLIGTLAAVICVLVWLSSRPKPGTSGAPQTAPETGVQPDELTAAQTSPATVLDPKPVPRSSVSTRRRSDAETPTPSSAPVSSAAEQTIGRLAQLSSDGPLSAEQAAAVKRDLQDLIGQGSSAVSAIQQFLKQNKDVSLDEIKGGSAVGYSSLRAGLFDALHQIGGSEAQSALADVLRTTADPGEVALLARHLEDLAPGQYRQDFLSAARESLAQAAETKSKADVGPLFQLLQAHGDAAVAPDLQNSARQWQYYSLMALAGLPEGQGVPALIQEAQQSSSGKSVFALQMLAQIAAQHPEAASALVDQAKAGQVPDRAWRRIAEALAGDQYQFIKDPNPDQVALLTRTPGMKTYHIEAGNENFYSVPLASNDPSVAQRRALVDQLLGATTQPGAVEALQRARKQLGP